MQFNRLGEIASNKLRDNNPALAHQSDHKRPPNIAEKFSELYENEWTELYDELRDQGKSSEQAIGILLKTVKVWNYVYHFELYCRYNCNTPPGNVAD